MLETDRQYIFLLELKEIIPDEVADFHLGAASHKRVSCL